MPEVGGQRSEVGRTFRIGRSPTSDLRPPSNEQAAWYYPEPLDAAEKIKGYVAFWKGVEVVE